MNVFIEVSTLIITIATIVATNSYYYGKLTQRVSTLETHQTKVEHHLGWDGSK